MASSLEWTDDTGSATLTNGYPTPGDRFAAWTMMSPLKSVEAETLGDGTLHVFEFHVKYHVSFELRYIPQDQVADALRLIRHLNRGGTVTVNTGDAVDRVYTCQRALEGAVELGPPDPITLRRTLKLTLRNTEEADLLLIWP
jgi:hypothetical protein